MKIILCSNTSWYLYNFRKELIRTLIDRKYDIILISPTDNYSERLKKLGCRHYNIKLDNKGTNPIKDINLMYQLYQLFTKIKPNILLTFTIKPNIYGGIVAKLLNISTISVVSGLGTVFLDNNKFSYKIAKLLYKIGLYNNKVVFENLDDSKEFVKQNLIKETQVNLIPGCGINTKISKPKTSINQSKKNITFLLVARLIKTKGIIEYIEAIKIIKRSHSNAKFKIIGQYYFDNPSSISKDEVDSWVANELIEYLGYTEAVLDEMEKVDCIVLPSYREGLSRVLLEAGIMSKPIITTNVAGCKEVVKNNHNGLLVPPKDIKSLAQAMEKIIKMSPQERQHMGKLGREKVINEFDESIVIKKYLSIISSYKEK